MAEQAKPSVPIVGDIVQRLTEADTQLGYELAQINDPDLLTDAMAEIEDFRQWQTEACEIIVAQRAVIDMAWPGRTHNVTDDLLRRAGRETT